MSTEAKRRADLDKMIVEVQRTVDDTRDCVHRGMAAKYNLLRVSERRWSIVRVSSVAATMFGIADVVTFEQVTGPLPFEQALAELRDRRTK